MGAHELGLRKILLHLLHVHQAHHIFLVALQVYLHIVFQTFYEQDVVQTYLKQLVLALHIDEAVAVVDYLTLLLGEDLLRLVYHTDEVFVADGLQKIVESAYLVAVDGILAESCGKHNLRGLRYQCGKLQTAQVGHLDVEKQQVYLLLLDVFDGGNGTVVGAHQIDNGRALGIAGQQLRCQGLIVNDDAV